MRTATRRSCSWTAGGGRSCPTDLLLRWSRFEYSETADAQPYDILLRAFENPDGEETTWYDAADLYKAWAKKQFWCKKTFLEKTEFLPPWTRDAPVVMEFNRAWFDRPAFLKKWLDEYWKKNFPDAPLLSILIGWEHHGDWITTEYFPVYPDEEKFAEMMGWVKAAGGHFWPWPGGHHWNVQVGKKDDGTFRLDFSKDFWERAAPHAVLDPDGKVRLDNLGWLGGGNSATMCPGDPWSVDWWNKDIACALVKRGADLVQADQDVGARVRTCWSTKHGHKPGPGRWLMHAQRHQFETMLAEMRKINPSAMFSFEEMHEYFNDIYAFLPLARARVGERVELHLPRVRAAVPERFRAVFALVLDGLLRGGRPDAASAHDHGLLREGSGQPLPERRIRGTVPGWTGRALLGEAGDARDRGGWRARGEAGAPRGNGWRAETGGAEHRDRHVLEGGDHLPRHGLAEGREGRPAQRSDRQRHHAPQREVQVVWWLLAEGSART